MELSHLDQIMDEYYSTRVGSSANHFGLEFLSQIDVSSNAIFSPLSLITALYIVYLGTEKSSESAKELSKILDFKGLNLNYNEPHEGLSTIYEYLRSDKCKTNQSMEFNVANLLLINKQTTGPLKDEFAQNLDHYYKIKIAQFNQVVNPDEIAIEFSKDILVADKCQLVEFDVSNTKDIADSVSEWVAKKTKNKIKNILHESSLPALQDLAAILVNTIYLKAKWNHFLIEDTEHDLFFSNGKKRLARIVPFMKSHDNVAVSYYSSSEAGTDSILGSVAFQALELPYEGNREQAISLVVLLPNKIDGLAEMEDALSPSRLVEIYKSLNGRAVDVLLPKFKFEQVYKVVEILEKLNVRKMFTEEANLTEMFEHTYQTIHANKVIHKAIIEVDESGVTAAAATVIVAPGDSATYEPTPLFRADHPFLYVVRHKISNAPLLIGRVTQF